MPVPDRGKVMWSAHLVGGHGRRSGGAAAGEATGVDPDVISAGGGDGRGGRPVAWSSGKAGLVVTRLARARRRGWRAERRRGVRSARHWPGTAVAARRSVGRRGAR